VFVRTFVHYFVVYVHMFILLCHNKQEHQLSQRMARPKCGRFW